jgi:hypothetical protein
MPEHTAFLPEITLPRRSGRTHYAEKPKPTLRQEKGTADGNAERLWLCRS